MLLVKRTTFHSKDSIDKTFSKLDWKVAKSETLIHPLLNSTIATSRQWVGKLDKENNRFEIIQSTPFFSPRIMECNFFRLYVFGNIIQEAQQTKIEAEFKLGIRSTLLFALISLFALLTIINFFRTNNWTALLVGLAPLMILVSLLTIQTNRTVNMLTDLFEE